MKKNLGGGFLVWHLVAICGAVILAAIIGIILYNLFSKEEPNKSNNPPQQPAPQQQEKRYQKNWVQVEDKNTGRIYAKNPEEEDGLDLDDFLSEYDPKHKYSITFAEQNDVVSGNGKRSSMAQSFVGHIYKDPTTNDFYEANGYYKFPNGVKYNDFDRKLSQQQLQQKQNNFFSKIYIIEFNGSTYHRNAKNKKENAMFYNLLTQLQTGKGNGLKIHFYQDQKLCFQDENKPDLYVKSFEGEYTEFGFPKDGTITYSDNSVVKLAPDKDVLREQNLEKLKQNVECIMIKTPTPQNEQQLYKTEYYTPNGGESIGGQKAKSFDSLPLLEEGQFCFVKYNLTTDNPFAKNDYQRIKTYTEYFDIIGTHDYPQISYTDSFQLAPAPKGFYNNITAKYNQFSQNNIKKITIPHTGEVLFDNTDENNSDFRSALYDLDTSREYIIEYDQDINLGDGTTRYYRGYVTDTFLPYQGQLFNTTEPSQQDEENAMPIAKAKDITDVWTSKTLQTQKVYNRTILHNLETRLPRVNTQGA